MNSKYNIYIPHCAKCTGGLKKPYAFKVSFLDLLTVNIYHEMNSKYNNSANPMLDLHRIV